MSKTALVVAGAMALGCGSARYVPSRMGLVDTHSPPEVEYTNGVFAANDDAKLYEQRWQPTQAVRGTVVFVHGLKDHSSRYRELAISFAQHGLAVHAFDLRGHGYSEGVRDHIGSLSRCLEDLGRVVGRVRDKTPGKPVFLVGQGFGATLAALYVVRTRPALGGIILSAPTLRTKVTSGERFETALSAIFAPRSAGLEIDYSKWSTDKDVVEALRRDPLVAPGEVTAGTTRHLLMASDEVQKRFGEITVPILILDGDKDEISDRDAITALAASAQAKDKTFTVYPGLAYDIFHEKAREQVVGDAIDWMHKYAPAPPAAPKAPPPAPPAKGGKKKGSSGPLL
jgi:alpha-beta hydrolase superfamily lysophospholipase